MKSWKSFALVFVTFFGLVTLAQLGVDEARGELGFGSSLCYSCESCLAAGCPLSYPKDPACAAFQASACQFESMSGYCGDGMCRDSETASTCPSDCKTGSSEEIKSTSPLQQQEKGRTPSAIGRVKGRVTDALSNPLARAFVNLTTSEGVEFGGAVDSDGYFDIRVDAGTYTLRIYSTNQTFRSPSLSSVTVMTGEIKELGNIVLLEKQERIQGRVLDSSGSGVADIEVSAWMVGGSEYTTTKSDTSGTFALFVSPGSWEVFARPDPDSNYYNPDPPARIMVEAGIISTIKFTLAVAQTRISGTVVDSEGNVLSDIYGFARLSPIADSIVQEFGGSLERGTFSFPVPAGMYMLDVFLAPGTPYTVGASQPVTLKEGITTSVQVVVSPNTAKIIGKITDQAGNIVTGFDVRVFATSKTGVWQEASFERESAQYTLNVAAGTWYVGYEISPDSGFLSFRDAPVEVLVNEGATVQKDLVVRKAGATVQGIVQGPEGNPVFQVFVGASKTSFSSVLEGKEFKDPMVAGTETNEKGGYSFAIPGGTYFLKTFVRPERGFINSEEKQIVLGEGEVVTVNLRLRRADLAIAGRVLLEGVPVKEAFVWAWSQKGGYQETAANSDGSFQLRVTAFDTWTIAAATKKERNFYKSSEVRVPIQNQSVQQDIELVLVGMLPAAETQTTQADQSVVVEVEDGATVVAPANAIASTGKVGISVTPDTRTPSQGEVKVVGIAYTVEARDQEGRQVTKLQERITVTLPYKDEDLVSLGSKEDDLVMSFWDEVVGTWKTIDGSVVNKANNTVTTSVDHLTRFAIVAAADITPPAPPWAVSAIVLADGRIQLRWVNPSGDFHHTKVYRSQMPGQLGSAIAVEVFGNELFDAANLQAGLLYYYTVRAVDGAGNESPNANQTAVQARLTLGQPQREIALPPGQAGLIPFVRNLTLGSRGPDVKGLQQFLNTRGFVLAFQGPGSPGQETEYFGPLTRGAIVRFQEAYVSEILYPLGLVRGTGFFGPASRTKANALLR